MPCLFLGIGLLYVIGMTLLFFYEDVEVPGILYEDCPSFSIILKVLESVAMLGVVLFILWGGVVAWWISLIGLLFCAAVSWGGFAFRLFYMK